MKNKIIWLKIYNNNYYQLLTKLNTLDVSIYDNKKEKDFTLLKVKYEDYLKIQKYLPSYKSSIYSYTGILKIIKLIKKYQIFIISSLISIFLLLILNNMIFKIDIKNNNKNIQTLLIKELKKNGLKPFTMKKSHQKIEKIVNKIIDSNKDTLEWLEIKYDGLIMIVNVTEKTIVKEQDNYPHCHIVASTDAKILSLNLYRGVPLKEVNDYVIKDEIILSGDVTFNDEVKEEVCASGEVYGEVWYNVKVTVPFVVDSIKYTGKSRYNINVKFKDNKYLILNSRIKNKKDQEINLYKFNDFEINLVKEKEYVIETKKLTEEKAYEKALNLAVSNISLKLDKDESILLKKVLKKEVNNSTIYLEVFIVTKENIGIKKVVEEEIDNGNISNRKSS